jgi:peptide/nickel transport system substrate-binding protein
MAPFRRPLPPLRRLEDRSAGRGDSRLSRRGLLAAGVLAGVLAATGVPVEARRRGGVLGLALAGGVPEGDDWSRAHPALLLAAHETLAEIAPDGALRPALAEGWEAGPGAAVWHLALASDAAFPDGAPLRPRDALASLVRPGSPLAADLAEAAEAGPRGLRLVLRRGDPDLPFRLADAALAVGRGGRLDGRGTGPYRAEGIEGGVLRLARAASHRLDGRAGWFDAIEAEARPDPRARLGALIAGRAGAADPLPPEMLAEARAAGLAVAEPVGGADGVPHAPALAHGAVSGMGPLDGGRIALRWWRAA